MAPIAFPRAKCTFYAVRLHRSGAVGATKNARHDNSAQRKLQGVENAGQENAAQAGQARQPNIYSQFEKIFFSARIVNIWNSLPNWVVDVQSIDIFKVRLDRFWAQQEVTFDWTAELT